MPIYEFKCQDCGSVSEILTQMKSRDEIITCKHCGSDHVERIFSTSFVSVKGESVESGRTCCGREERCASPPCSRDDVCRNE